MADRLGRNPQRYFIEWDRGTEPVAGAKETRTILDKLKRAHEYFWIGRSLSRPGRHWSQRGSYYLDAFKGEELRRPKVLIITRSPKRAENIWKLALRYFRDVFSEEDLLGFMEVLTVPDAAAKLRKVVAYAEGSPKPTELPWVAELREQAARAAQARAEGERIAKEEAARRAKEEAQAAAARAAAQEKRRLEIEELRKQGKWKTHEDVEREMREQEEAARRRQQGVLGKLKDLVGGK